MGSRDQALVRGPLLNCGTAASRAHRATSQPLQDALAAILHPRATLDTVILLSSGVNEELARTLGEFARAYRLLAREELLCVTIDLGGRSETSVTATATAANRHPNDIVLSGYSDQVSACGGPLEALSPC